MLATVTLNPTVDKTYFIDKLEYGEVNRVREMTSLAGGKGINVARIAAIMGQAVTATGFAGRGTGRMIQESLEKYRIRHDFCRIAGESRICVAVKERDSRKVTEFLEAGPEISGRELAGIKAKVNTLSKKCRITVLAGSLPRGVRPEIYSELIGIIKKNGGVPILDSSGKALVAGIEGRPYMVKPNRAELETLLGSKAISEAETLRAIKDLQGRGIPLVIVSLGAEGSLVGWDNDYYRAVPPSIDPVNTVGCGDSLVAGVAMGIIGKMSREETIRYATAVSTANALTPLAAVCNPEDVKRLQPEVKVEKLTP